MVKLNAKKDGLGNIVISEDSFEHLLNCLANQKFVGEAPPCGDAIDMGREEYAVTQNDMQAAIDNFYVQCREVLHNS